MLVGFAPTMNSKQKAVRAVGALVLGLMIIFPPWKLSYRVEGNATALSSSIGYHPLWYREPPESAADDTRLDLRHHVDLGRLGLQLAVVFVLVNAGVYFVKKRSST